MNIKTRFQGGDEVTHAGRPAIVALVHVYSDETRYGIYYTDGDREAVFNLLGRVLSNR